MLPAVKKAEYPLADHIYAIIHAGIGLAFAASRYCDWVCGILA